MSDRYKGGIIRSAPFTTSKFGQNSGMFTLGQQFNAIAAGQWPSDFDVVRIFSGAGSYTIPSGVTEIEYLVIAGGGSGGVIFGGGGGAGGMRFGTASVTPGNEYTISVGAGGAATAALGNDGSDSSLAGPGLPSPATITSTGGGGGGGHTGGTQGRAGGSGGGGAYYYVAPNPAPVGRGGSGNDPSTSPAQGNDGGGMAQVNVSYGAGGGGGAGQTGFDALLAGSFPSIPYAGGNGGNGLSSSITGTAKFYAGGGGGSTYPHALALTKFGKGGLGGGGNGGGGGRREFGTTVENGQALTGGGGGGTDAQPGGAPVTPAGYPGQSGLGGSGVVIIKHKTRLPDLQTVYTFNGSGVFENTVGAKTIDYLIVGGGASGGMGRGGGGGAGGFRVGSGLSIVPGSTYTITVGAGGAGISPSGGAIGKPGTSSSFTGDGINISSNGGGHGGCWPNARGGTGGSGGGGGGPAGAAGPGNLPKVLDNPSPITAQGFDGGVGQAGPRDSGGGGGGAGGVGGDGNAANGFAAHGGNGRAFDITGVSTFYAGGGGGCGDPFGNRGGLGGGGNGTGGTGAPTPFNSNHPSHPNIGLPGGDNTGGGGGGGSYPFTSLSGLGGSGVVIIKLTG